MNYLKNKPTGALISEAKAALRQQVLDTRKLTAYVKWGIVNRDGDRLKLTELGWDMARKPSDEANQIRRIIDRIPSYRSTLEWIHHQGFDTVTTVDVGAHLHEHHSSELGTDNPTTIKLNAVCFFHIAEGAGLGKQTVGRKGAPTRLQVNREALKEYIEAGPSTPPWAPSIVDIKQDSETDGSEQDTTDRSEPEEKPQPSRPAPEQLRVFIAHGKNMQIVEQVQTMLGLADIICEVAEQEETAAIPVSDKVFIAMRKCTAGVIAVTVDEGEKSTDGEYILNNNVLIEIGAAFVLYDKRVVLLWDKRLEVPSNLQGLYRCEFEGDELTWSAGMKLMKAIQSFKK